MPAAGFMDAVLKGKHPGYPVKKNGEFMGYLSLYTLRDLEEKERENALVRDIMNKNYPTIAPGDSVFHALNLMNKYNWGRIMVTEEKNGKKNLVGVISKSDVIKAYEKLME